MDEKNRHTNNEKLLFHGTDADSLPHVNKNGFNRSYAGKNGKEASDVAASNEAQTRETKMAKEPCGLPCVPSRFMAMWQPMCSDSPCFIPQGLTGPLGQRNGFLKLKTQKKKFKEVLQRTEHY